MAWFTTCAHERASTTQQQKSQTKPTSTPTRESEEHIRISRDFSEQHVHIKLKSMPQVARVKQNSKG
jgi:hypothetical protein